MSSKKTGRGEPQTLADKTTTRRRYTPRSSRGTVGSAIREWWESVEWDGLKPGTQTSYTTYITPLYRGMGQVELAAVRRSHLMKIRDTIATDRGHGAALVFCHAVSAFFSWAMERELIEASPAMKLATKLKRGSWPAWRDDQAKLAMRELPEPFRRAVVLAYHTGQRRGDLCKLRWADYDGEVIRLTQEKTDEPLEIPVHHMPAFKAELDAWKRERTTLTILEHLGKPWEPNYLSSRLPRYLEAIGLPRQLGLHGLRRLTAVRLAEAGCTPHQIAAITGHRTLAMVQHYTRGVRQRNLADVAILSLVRTK